ncbi:MAG: hypothetical protein ABH934_00100 [Chloroflexota bacterium]
MLKLAGEMLEGQLAEHTTDLDTHTLNIWNQYRIGQYIGFGGTTGSGVAIAADTLYAMLFPVVRTMTFDRIATYIATLADGKTIRLGIYADDGNLYPGALALDAGTASVATTDTKAITIDKQLTKEFYWLVFISDGIPALYRGDALDRTMWTPTGLSATSLRYATAGWTKTQAFGALPDPFPSGGSLEIYNWAIALRPSSMDQGG